MSAKQTIDKVEEPVSRGTSNSSIVRQGSVSIYENKESMVYKVTKLSKAEEEASGKFTTNQEQIGGGLIIASNVSEQTITWLHKPLNDTYVYTLADVSTHHSTCLSVKTNATVGLGFYDAEDEEAVKKQEESLEKITKAIKTKDSGFQAGSVLNGISALAGAVNIRSKVDESLDPLTLYGWNNTLLMAIEDYYTLGRGHLEVVRSSSDDTIISINFLQASKLQTGILEKDGATYIVYGYSETANGISKIFASYGQGKNLKLDTGNYTEVISFIMPSNRHPLIGYPKWLSAVPSIDLTKKAKQFKADFYTNRGVLDYILVLKSAMNKEEFDEWVKSLQSATTEGNKFKSAVMQLNEDTQDSQESLTHIPLAGDTTANDQFPKDQESLASEVVTAHQVPPVLGNILIAGKMGATNEVINALVSFQLITIHSNQFNVANTLARTLGSEDNQLGLTRKDFNLRTVLSQMNVGAVDTVARMREEATNTDRDIEDGLKE